MCVCIHLTVAISNFYIHSNYCKLSVDGLLTETSRGSPCHVFWMCGFSLCLEGDAWGWTPKTGHCCSNCDAKWISLGWHHIVLRQGDTVLTRVPAGCSVSLNDGLRRRCIADLDHDHGQVWRRQFSKEFMSQASSGRRWPLQRRLNAAVSPSGDGQCKHLRNPAKSASLSTEYVTGLLITMALVWHDRKLPPVFSQRSNCWFAA